MADGLICGLGAAVVIGISKVPLGPRGKPAQEGDELPAPDCTSPAAPIEFESSIVCLQAVILQRGPVGNWASLKNLCPTDVCLGLDQCLKTRAGTAVPALEGARVTADFTAESAEQRVGESMARVVVFTESSEVLSKERGW